jgi:PAS domain-containing protein
LPEKHKNTVPIFNQQRNSADSRLIKVFDTMLVGIVIIDPWSHTIVYANDEAGKILRRQASDLLGHVCHNFICPIVAGNCPITEHGREIDRSERCVLDRDGNRTPVVKTVRKIEFDGRIHFLETFMNISDLKQKEYNRARNHSKTY